MPIPCYSKHWGPIIMLLSMRGPPIQQQLAQLTVAIPGCLIKWCFSIVLLHMLCPSIQQQCAHLTLAILGSKV